MSTGRAPAVSVNMCAYNAARYVGEALTSVLQQTMSDFEVVVVDDGSTDDTAAIVRRFAEQDARVRLISRPNTGVVGARNDAWRASRGEYIAVLDADDVALPERFARQCAWLETHAECVAVGSAAIAIDADGDPLARWFEQRGHEALDAMNLSGEHGAAMCHSSMMIRRPALAAAGGYREPYATAEDLDLWLRLAEAGQLATLAEPLVRYRCHESSLGFSQQAKQRAAAAAAIAAARERRGLPPAAAALVARGHASTNHVEFAWMALGAGYRATARKHAWRQLAKHPLQWRSWRLLFFALRGR